MSDPDIESSRESWLVEEQRNWGEPADRPRRWSWPCFACGLCTGIALASASRLL